MLPGDLFYTLSATGEKTLHGIGVQPQRIAGEFLVMCMIHGIGLTQDVPGKKAQYKLSTACLTTFSDGPDAFNCVLPGFHVRYHINQKHQITYHTTYSAQLSIS